MTQGETVSRVRPLTLRDKEGVLYCHAPAVAQQIEAALDLSASDVLARAALGPAAPDYLSNECLAYLLREFQRAGDQHLVAELAGVLLRRCVPSIHARLRLNNETLREEAYDEAVRRLLTRLLDLNGNKSDYYQVRFADALKALTIDVFRKYLRMQEKQEQTVPLGHTGDEEDDDTTGIGELPDTAPDPFTRLDQAEQRERVYAVLAQLPPDVRRAVVLKYVDGWPIEHSDPSVPTISARFNKTPRTINNWLRQAKRALAESLGEQE